MNYKLLLRVVSLLFILSLIGLKAQIITVGPGGSPTYDYASIQDAINAASGGETIEVAAGTYTENISITKSLTLRGPNANVEFDSRLAESIISPASGTPITVSAAGVTINGFEITSPNNTKGIIIAHKSDITLSYNYIHNIATNLNGYIGQEAIAISYGIGSGTANTVIIDNNKIELIGNSALTKKSSSAISFTQKASTGSLDNLVISNNIITDVNVSTADWDNGGRIAYGILLGVGATGGGKISDFTIKNNEISNLTGFISTGIGLEGNTDNTNSTNGGVFGNTVMNLTGYKNDIRNKGGYDLSALKFEDNDYVSTCTVENNAFNTNTFVHDGTVGRGYAVSNYVTVVEGGIANVSKNWLGTNNPPLIPDNNDLDGKIFNKENCETVFSPWLAEAGGTTYVPDPTDPNSLSGAINSVPSGSTIDVPAGTYNSVSVTTDGITLVGNGAVINSASPAITISANNVTVTGFTFNFVTADYAIQVDDGVTNTNVYDCKFYTTKGIENRTTTGEVAKAEENFWGKSSGPTHSTNVGGTGSLVTDYVDFSPWYSDATFTTYGMALPSNSITGVSILPTFKWGEVDGVTDYTLKIGTVSGTYTDIAITSANSTVSNGIVTYIAEETQTQFPLTNDKIYYWTVTDGTNTFAENYFKTTADVSLTLSYPADDADIYAYDPLQFSWYLMQSTGNLRFALQVVNDLNTGGSIDAADWEISNLEKYADNINGLFRSLTGLKGGSNYYWRVIAYINETGGTTGYEPAIDKTVKISDVNYFTTMGGAVVAYPSYPIGGETVYTKTPMMNWYTMTYEPSARYQIIISTADDDNNNDILDDGTQITLPSTPTAYTFTTVPSGNLTPGSHYYWQVVTTYGTQTKYSAVEDFILWEDPNVVPQKPILSYPVNETIYTTAPTMSWYVNGYSTQVTYTLEFNKDGAGWQTYPTTTKKTYLKVNGLVPGATYEWRVTASNGTYTPQTSEPGTFTVIGGDYSITVANYPKGDLVWTTKPTLGWTVEGSTLGWDGFKVRVYKGTTAPGTWATYDEEFTVSSVNTTYYTFTTAREYGATYFWAVALWDGTNPPDADKFSQGSFVVYGGEDGITIVNQSPEDGTIDVSTSPMVTWSVTGVSPNITNYTVQYSQFMDPTLDPLYPTFTGQSVDANLLTYATLSNLDGGSTYKWRVVADLQNGNPVSSGWTEFTTVATNAPPQPVAGSPLNGVPIAGNNVNLSWYQPVAPIENQTFVVEVSKTANFAEVTVINDISKSNVFVDNLENGTYYWRVKGVNSNGTSHYSSNVGKFNVGTITSVENEEIPSTFNIEQNYPNPFNPETIIKFSLPEAEFVTLKIYNMLGQEVITLIQEQKNLGNHSVVWNGKDNRGNQLASGTYIYRITAGEFNSTKKMVLIK